MYKNYLTCKMSTADLLHKLLKNSNFYIFLLIRSSILYLKWNVSIFDWNKLYNIMIFRLEFILSCFDTLNPRFNICKTKFESRNELHINYSSVYLS